MMSIYTLSSYIMNQLNAARTGIRKNNYQSTISICDRVIREQHLTQKQKDQFLYLKSIAKDMSNQNEEALAILIDLKSRNPDSVAYHNSAKIVINSIGGRIRELIVKDPSSEKIGEFVETATEIEYCPWRIRAHHLKMMALAGRYDEAKELMDAYLGISPNDHEFLRVALELASIGNDQTYSERLVTHICELLRKYPFRYELSELLDDCQNDDDDSSPQSAS
jgi:hypothetical protein